MSEQGRLQAGAMGKYDVLTPFEGMPHFLMEEVEVITEFLNLVSGVLEGPVWEIHLPGPLSGEISRADHWVATPNNSAVSLCVTRTSQSLQYDVRFFEREFMVEPDYYGTTICAATAVFNLLAQHAGVYGSEERMQKAILDVRFDYPGQKELCDKPAVVKKPRSRPSAGGGKTTKRSRHDVLRELREEGEKRRE